MNPEIPSIVEDPDFKLTFVNKKSSERVQELVDEIRKAFAPRKEELDTSPMKALELIENDPSLIFKSPQIEELTPDSNPPAVMPPRLASLKPFLFPYHPAADIRTQTDPEFGPVKRKFMEESRIEHHRLLWAFQDRLVRDLCAADDQFQLSPFQIATTQLAKEQALPIHLVEKRKENLQNRFSHLMKKSQKLAAQVIDSQKRNSKLLQDRKQFDIQYEMMQKNDAKMLTEKPVEFPVYCPFSFLFDQSYTKG